MKKGNIYESHGGNRQLAAAVYPQMPPYPEQWNDEALEEWYRFKDVLSEQPSDYKDGFDDFFSLGTRAFLAKTENKNRVYSPLSLYMALGLSAEVTDGVTRQQIIDAMYQDNIDKLRSHSKSVWQANYIDDGMAKCVLGTSLWLNNDFAYNNDTIRLAAENYYSSVYTGDPADEEYGGLMRNWINEQTDGLLENQIPDIRLDRQMILSIASTVGYSCKWTVPFDKKRTRTGTFRSPDGNVKCSFMRKTEDTDFILEDKFTSASICTEENGKMRFILPCVGTTPEELLRDDEVMELLKDNYRGKNRKNVVVNFTIPRFDISSGIDLGDGLKKMGVTDIFDPGSADFTPLSDSKGIFLPGAEQDSRVMIDEKGCKASSLTAMLAYGAAMSLKETVEFKLDRPFIFEILGKSGLPLFAGIVNDPSQN